MGPSNLITILETIPPYWVGFYKDMTRMLGADKKTSKGTEMLDANTSITLFRNCHSKEQVTLVLC